MKIAVLLRNFVTTGGAEKYAVEVTQRLAKHHEVTVFCQAHDDKLAKRLKIQKVFKLSEKPRWLNSLIFAILSYKATHNKGFDAIHSHERTFHFDALVVHCPCYITKFKEAGAKGLFKYKLRQFLSLRHACYAWLERRQFKNHPKRTSIVVSDYVARNIRMCYPESQNKMAIAPPGVKQSLQPARPPQKGEALKVLFVGTEFKRKGLEHAIRGFAASKHQNSQLTVAGGGDPTEFLTLAKSLGVQERVQFLGLVSDVDSLYSKSHLFLFPTIIEPFGMSPLEAMAHGLPVIVSPPENNGFVEQLKDGEAIVLKDLKNPQEIGAAIDSFTDLEVWKRYSDKSLTVAQRLSWEHCAKVHEEVLAGLGR
jgi:UDP-glucose:(heptosyl)LPS alpha-1,3-glucosyltransferase